MVKEPEERLRDQPLITDRQKRVLRSLITELVDFLEEKDTKYSTESRGLFAFRMFTVHHDLFS